MLNKIFSMERKAEECKVKWVYTVDCGKFRTVSTTFGSLGANLVFSVTTVLSEVLNNWLSS